MVGKTRPRMKFEIACFESQSTVCKFSFTFHDERGQGKKRGSLHAGVPLAPFTSALMVQEVAMTMFRYSPIQPVLAIVPLLPVPDVGFDSIFLDSSISSFLCLQLLSFCQEWATVDNTNLIFQSCSTYLPLVSLAP